MLKSHILHMTHLGGIRHLHKHHIHRHGHGAYGTHQKKGCGVNEYMKAQLGMTPFDGKSPFQHLYGSGYYDEDMAKAEAIRESRKPKKRFPPVYPLDVLKGSGSKHGHKHIKPLKFKM